MDGSLGHWAVCLTWMMVVAMVRQPLGSQKALTNVSGGCDRLGKPVPKLPGGTCKWALVIVAGWVGPSLGPWEECIDGRHWWTAWGGSPGPQMVCLGTGGAVPGHTVCMDTGYGE